MKGLTQMYFPKKILEMSIYSKCFLEQPFLCMQIQNYILDYLNIYQSLCQIFWWISFDL